MGAKESTLVGRESKLLSEYDLKKVLGAGAFGAVIKVEDKFDKNCYAIKLVHLTAERKTDSLKEVQIFSKLATHQHVVSYKRSWIDVISTSQLEEIKKILALTLTDQSKKILAVDQSVQKVEILCIGMELCQESLRDWKNKRIVSVSSETIDSLRGLYSERLNKVNEDANLLILSQVLSGLQHIHDHGIIHRDLKPDNIFLTVSPKRKLVAKIGDLGIAKAYDFTKTAEQHTRTGTILYIPQEQLCGKYGPMVDIYPLGIILFELFYPGPLEQRYVNMILKLRSEEQLPHVLEKRWPEIAELIRSMIKSKYHERANIEDLQVKIRDIARIFARGYAHWSVVCDGCKMSPLRGLIRYKCKTCDDFDFCPTCKENPQNGHDEQHEFQLMDVAASEKVYLDNIAEYLKAQLRETQEKSGDNGSTIFECSKCEQTVDASSQVVRKCQKCAECYYCENCFTASLIHRRLHQFKRVAVDGAPEVDEPASSSSDDQDKLLFKLLLAMVLEGKTGVKN